MTIIVLIICIFILVNLVSIYIFRLKNKQFIIRNHERYQKIFNYYIETAYDTIWKSQILSYINNGMKPSGSERETIERNFCKTLLSIMGPNLEKYIIEFFGSEEVFWTNVINYFEYRMDSEEIEDLIKRTKKAQSAPADKPESKE